MSRRAKQEWVLSSLLAGRLGAAKQRRWAGSFNRRLGFEPLEDRRLLSITVNTLIDENDGIGVGGISLRDAIAAASSGETINFAAALTSGGPATIQLSSLGHLAINKDLTINGPGANLLTIKAYDPTPTVKNADGSSVFIIDDGNAGIFKQVSVSGLTLSGGDSFGGGGILNVENLAIASSTISGNAAIGGEGGGIRSNFGNLTVTASTISGNVAYGSGGGITNVAGNLTVTASTISGNSVSWDFGRGGGLANISGNLTVIDSTIAGNSSNGIGGGISNSSGFPTQTTVSNSTISGNSAFSGGGVYNAAGLTEIRHSTVTNNSAYAGEGSGVASNGTSGTQTKVQSTIIAGNINSDVDVVLNATPSFQSNGYNLVGTGNALASFNQTGDQTGVTNPGLGSLAANGGPTMTHALLISSPAIDAGNPGFTPPPTYDQRGNPFGRVVDGDGAAGAQIDIGAFEAPALPSDYNRNGTVDAADYVLWRKTLGTTGVQAYSGADGSGNGTIGPEDYGVWRAHFGQTLPPPGAGSKERGLGSGEGVAVGQAVPDANGAAAIGSQAQPDLLVSAAAGLAVSERLPHVAASAAADADAADVGWVSPTRPTLPLRELGQWRDAALVAWLASRVDDREGEPVETGPVTIDGTARDATDDALDAFDAAFSTLVGAELR